MKPIVDPPKEGFLILGAQHQKNFKIFPTYWDAEYAAREKTIFNLRGNQEYKIIKIKIKEIK